MTIEILLDILTQTGLLFLDMAPYLLLGLTVAGVLDAVMSKRFVARHIGRPGLGSVIKASLLGVPLPLCSCGVVPTASYLKRAGASKPAVMSFLISTPQTGVDSIAATYGMLGPLFAVFRPIAALLTGVAGGIASHFGLRKREADAPATTLDTAPAESSPTGRRPRLLQRVRQSAKYAYVDAVDDIAVQFIFGLLVGGIISVLLPDDFFVGRAIGSGLPAMLLMVAVGLPMYVCSTSSIPIAVALIAKGLSPGAAYVFLVAGPATNAATLAILMRVLGLRQTVLYVATLIVGSLAFGPAVDALGRVFGGITSAAVAEHHQMLGPADYVFAAILGVLVLAAMVRKIGGGGSEEAELTVKGMTCNHCG